MPRVTPPPSYEDAVRHLAYAKTAIARAEKAKTAFVFEHWMNEAVVILGEARRIFSAATDRPIVPLPRALAARRR